MKREAAPGGVLLAQFAVAGSAILWGLWWLPIRFLEARGLAGDWVSVVVYGAGALGLLPFVLRGRRQLRGHLRTIAASGLCFGLMLALWNHAILVGEVVRVTLLFYLSPIWATLMAAAFLGERITLNRVLAIVLGLTGAAIVLGLDTGRFWPQNEADWMAIIGGISFAACATIIRRGGEGNSLPQSFTALFSAALLAWSLAIFHPAGASVLDRENLSTVLPLAVAVGIFWLLPLLLLVLWGAGRLDPGRVAILLLLEVVAAAVSASILTNEPFGLKEVLGCFLIIASGMAEIRSGWPWSPPWWPTRSPAPRRRV